MGPLAEFIMPSDIRRVGFLLTSTVVDVNINGKWLWPQVWLDKLPSLLNCPPIHLDLNRDELILKNDDVMFSATTVWDCIRLKENRVGWVDIVWLPQCIPSLCVSDYDSHGHLFFTYKYADKVWCEVKKVANMQHLSSSWDSIVLYLLSKAKSRSISSVLGRLVVAASAYYIWQERNNRLFKNHARPPDILVKTIKDTVRARLWKLKFKKTARVTSTLEAWVFGENFFSKMDAN
uniref:uncharacterized protein LOC122584457 n=1 Tax=Erigeron canadensis TaxID=72917 RepID=UPI001CB97C59|nr:uncharacterized protein LOC122584457 [Erigeron canadensis]